MVYNINQLSENLKKGFLELERYKFLQHQEEGIALQAICGEDIIIDKSETVISITFDTEPHFYMALALSMGMNNGIHKVEKRGSKLGLMLDCSRNAVAKPNTVQELICLLVMMGYDYLELYTEDTYELPDEPYFGYKRGRYSREELKEIVDFADLFQFEIVPCIQTLAHLKHLANWKPYYDHMDLEDILLVGDERTYNLIRKSLRFWKEVCHTSRINIGCDEAFHVGCGKYIDENGYKCKHEVYLEHMQRVFQICREEGMCPEFWADGFYAIEKPVEEVQSLFDGSQIPIVWKYGHLDADLVRERIEKLRTYAGRVMFAGGLWKWLSYAPDNRYSQKALDVMLEVAQECEVDNVLLTAWGDDGTECSPFAIIPAMWHAAHKLYPCKVDSNKIISHLTGYSKEEWESCDNLNYVMPQLEKMSNAAKYLLYNDYLIGLLDYNTPEHAGEIYSELLPTFTKLAERDSRYSYIFASYAALCKVLICKATYSKRLYQAYQEKNHQAIRRLMDELREIQVDLKAFYDIYRKQWMRENKGFGFEVLDLRIGGLIVRADTVLVVLEDYLAGRTERIYELDEERIEYFCGQLTGDEVYAPVHGLWATAYTVNHI